MENILRKRREKLSFREQNPAELGKWIREHRKEQGLRLEDLARVGLSIATISNIERGIPRVRPEKFALLLEKLNLGEKDWQKRLSSSEREWEETLFTAEIFLRAGNPMEALRELESTGEKRGMKNSNYHLLKGECFFRMGNLIRAERCFLLAIRLSQRELLESEGNIEAAAYCGLGEIRGKEGEWKRALLLTETGLKKYDFRNGESYLLFNLWRNRAGCLLKLGRKWEALSTLKMVWKSVNRSPFSDGVLSLYILRARTHLGLNQYAEALQFASEGLNRAAAEGRVGKMYELAGVLAEATLMKGDRAEPKGTFVFWHGWGIRFPQRNGPKDGLFSGSTTPSVGSGGRPPILLKERDVSEMKRNGRICWPGCIWNGGIANRPERTLPGQSSVMRRDCESLRISAIQVWSGCFGFNWRGPGKAGMRRNFCAVCERYTNLNVDEGAR